MKEIYRRLLSKARYEVSFGLNKLISNELDDDIIERIEAKREVSKLDEIISLIALDLWKQKKFEVLKNYKNFLVLDKQDLDMSYFGRKEFIKLCEIIKRIDLCKNEINKKIWYAKGFAELYHFKEAIFILDEILNTDHLTRKKEIEIRRLLENWYFEDDFDSEERLDNYLKLILLNPQDNEVIIPFFKSHLSQWRFSDKEKKVAIEILNKYGTVLEWEYLKEGADLSQKVFLELFEAVYPIDIFSTELIQFVLESYFENNDLTIVQKIIEDAKSNKLWDKSLSIYEAKLFFYSEKYDAAETIFKEILNTNSLSPTANLYMGHISHLNDKIQDALKYYKIYNEKTGYGIEYLLSCELKLENFKAAENAFQKWYASKNFNYSVLSGWIEVEYFPADFIITCLENIMHVKKAPSISVYRDSDNMIYHFFSVTKNMQGKGAIRYNLLRLYQLVINIKQKLMVNLRNTTEIYHYSNLESLNYLTKYKGEGKEPSYFRLSNVAYMNDPLEGNCLFEIFKDKIKDNKIEGICSKIIENESYAYRNTYLACFSLKKDMLPMWVQYGDNGKGTCYVIDTCFFEKNDNLTEKHVLGKIYYENAFQFSLIEEEAYPLYNVYYYNKNEESEIVNLCLETGNVLLQLNEVLEIRDIWELVIGLMDEVRYLIKDCTFSTESEVRIIGKDLENKKKAFRGNNCRVPHLYLDLEKSLVFKEIILGPKVDNISELTAYLKCCTNVGKVTKSKIKYI